MEEQQVINSNKSELWNLSLKDLFYKYVRFLPLFLLSVAIALFVAFAYLRYTTRIYSATGSMLIKNEQPSGRSDKLESILEGGDNRAQNIQNEIEVLKSRPLMERVVKKLNLEFSYTAKGKIKDYNIYKQGPFVAEAFEIKDSTSGFSLDIKFINDHQFRVDNGESTFSLGELFENPHGVFRLVKKAAAAAGSEYTISWQPCASVAGGLAGGVRVQPKTPGTSILSISLQSTNGLMAADIVNYLMVEYDSMTVEQNGNSNDQMLGFINERLDSMNRELDIQQVKFLKYKQDNNLFDVDKQLSEYFIRYSEADKNADVQQFKVDIADEIDAYVKDKKNQYNTTTPSALLLEDATLIELVGSYNRVQLERRALLDANVPPAHPLVKGAEGQIEEIRKKVIENLGNIRLSLHSAINVLKSKSRTEQSKLEALPFKLKEYVEMERQIMTKLELKNLLEAKREEIAIQKAAITSNSKVIDVAGASTVPVKPNKKTIQILAILIGIGLPALLIFIGEILNDKVNTRFDIERLTQAPILGEIGHSFADNTLIVNKTSRTMVAEQFRIIRSNLQYVVNKPDKSVILVTSSFSGEGKSFISTNMAAVLALAGKKTI
ncbi:MAG: GumC family protein, partial [Chitinophagales bacterium]